MPQAGRAARGTGLKFDPRPIVPAVLKIKRLERTWPQDCGAVMGGIQIRNRIFDVERGFDVHDGKADADRQSP
jgi:hypothetical protein